MSARHQHLYAFNENGNLHYYRHKGKPEEKYAKGSGDVSRNGIHTRVAAHNGEGTLFVVEGGNLKWYRDTSFGEGKTFEQESGSVIGNGGWDSFRILTANGRNIIYAATADGKVKRYHYLGYGNEHYSPNSGAVVADWAGVQHFSADKSGNGVIYVVKDGNLLWYRDISTKDGVVWAQGSGTVIGKGGWDQFKQVVAGKHGVLYCLNKNGNLHYYKHLGGPVEHYVEGSGKVIGQGGWEKFSTLAN